MSFGEALTNENEVENTYDWWDVPLHERHMMDLPMDRMRAQLPENGTYDVLPYTEHFISVDLPASEQDVGYPDEAKMHVALWLPDVEEGVKVPVIMTIHPYYDFGGEGMPGVGADSNPNTIPDGGVGQWVYDTFVPHGYALAQASTFGTGKSTHIEQVAARLQWPAVRVNLDSHISRIDLIGKDAIKLRDGVQITEFHEGILPWALRNPVAIVFDEYDAGRADVMFVIQRVLEHDGKLTLMDQNEIIQPNPNFRLFATANTVGLGDTTGLYHGTQQINQAQMDRWSLVATLNYLSVDAETAIVLAKAPHYNTDAGRKTIKQMVTVADLTRTAFMNGDLSTVMSPRTVIAWAQNAEIFRSIGYAFRLSFLNKCDELERQTVAEFYQRCFDEELPESAAAMSVS